MFIGTTQVTHNCQYLPNLPSEFANLGVFRCGEFRSWSNDIVVTINFTSFPVVSIERKHLSLQSVRVMLSYTNNTKQAIDHTRPAFLIPGIDLVGISRTRIQQTFKNRALSAFGMFDVRSIPLFDLRTR